VSAATGNIRGGKTMTDDRNWRPGRAQGRQALPHRPGRYTDDISLPRQTYAYFVRSPHAHATINGIDVSAPRRRRASLAVFTGEDMKQDGIGGLICGWMIHSKDGSPMKAGPAPRLADGKVRYVGDHVAMVVAESLDQAQAAADLVEVTYGTLPADRRHRRRRKAPAPRRSTTRPPTTPSIEWELGDKGPKSTRPSPGRARHENSTSSTTA
jgi:aerobic carbon-monoxide dehydrogenase large subunit